MSQENKQLIEQWFDEVWNKKNEAAIDEMLSEETVHHGLGGTESADIRGIEEFKNFHRAFVSAFPDLKVTIDDCITEGDKLSIRCRVTGTHTGAGLGIEPTEKKVEFTGSGICTVRDGKFVEIWNEFDFMKMYLQLGMLSLNQK